MNRRMLAVVALLLGLVNLGQADAAETRPDDAQDARIAVSHQPVYIKCAYGDIVSTTDKDGIWTADASSVGFPCIVAVNLPENGKLHSYIDAPGEVSVNPFTEVALAESLAEGMRHTLSDLTADAILAIGKRLPDGIALARKKFRLAGPEGQQVDFFHALPSEKLNRPANQGTAVDSALIRGRAVNAIDVAAEGNPTAGRDQPLLGGRALRTAMLSDRKGKCSPGSIWLQADGMTIDDTHPADGSALDVATYPELARRLGSRYGGNGTATFSLPDFRALAPPRFHYVICVYGHDF